MITIQELLYSRGLDKTAAVKLVRHKDGQYDLYSLYRHDRFDATYKKQEELCKPTIAK